MYVSAASPLLRQPVRVVPSLEADEASVVVRRGVLESVDEDSVLRLCAVVSLVDERLSEEAVVSLVVGEPAFGAEGVEAPDLSFAHPPRIKESSKVPGIIHLGFISYLRGSSAYSWTNRGMLSVTFTVRCKVDV